MSNYRLKYGDVELEIEEGYEITKSSQDIVYSDITCNFIGYGEAHLPERYQEVQIVDLDTRKIIAYGYIDNYEFGELRETDVDRDIKFTLLSPMKMTTLRTCIAVGMFDIIDLMENYILAPLLEEGFTIKEMNLGKKIITTNFVSQTIEYCMNNLSNKFNFWWYIDENKNIYIKNIDEMMKKKPILEYTNSKHPIGLEYIKPITNSDNYANVINFTNVRIYESVQKDKLINEELTNINTNTQITFKNSIDIKKENIIKSAESNAVFPYEGYYALYISGFYTNNTEFEAYIKVDTEGNYIVSNNIGFQGNNEQKDFMLVRDSFFKNLITGFEYHGENIIREITTLNSVSALIWNVNKFYNDAGIESKKGIINKTGIVELTIDMNQSWKTIQELVEIGNSYLNKNNLEYADEIELQMDVNTLNVGDLIYINKFMIENNYIVTEIRQTEMNGEIEYLIKGKNANMLNNFIDIFRKEETQQSSQQTYEIYITHYNEDIITEKHKVVI